MNKIYFTSDLHFGHTKDFLYGPRGFSTPDEMNKTIVTNWNEIIDCDDDVYVLGDLMLEDNNIGISYFNQLNGHIHVIRGNHDTDARWELYKTLPSIIELSEGKFFKYKGYNFYLSHYPCLCGNHDEDKPLKKRYVSLCGHSHTNDKFIDWDKGLIYHVELDAHNNTPILIDTIIKDLINKLQ